MNMLPLALLLIEDESDRAFMISVYEEHRKLMLQKAKSMLKSDWDVHEVIGDACGKLVAKVDVLRQLSGDSLRRYVVITVEHAAIDLIRKKNRENQYVFLSDDEILQSIPSKENAVDETIIRAGELKTLKLALSKLSNRDRWIMSMRYDEQLSHREMARRMGVKEKSVSVILDRVYKRLRVILEKEEFDVR